jgi:hypothetical protein
VLTPRFVRAEALLVPALAMAIAVSPAAADPEDTSRKRVYAQVDPTLLVSEGSQTVNLGRIGTGEVCGTLSWRIHANKSRVRFTVGASDLWKGGSPQTPGSRPIPLLRSEGVEMDVEHGGPLWGQDRFARFQGQTMIDRFPMFVSESITFESSQANRFSQYLTTTLCWNQEDPEKPKGQYSGLVYLWVVILPGSY